MVTHMKDSSLPLANLQTWGGNDLYDRHTVRLLSKTSSIFAALFCNSDETHTFRVYTWILCIHTYEHCMYIIYIYICVYIYTYIYIYTREATHHGHLIELIHAYIHDRRKGRHARENWKYDGVVVFVGSFAVAIVRRKSFALSGLLLGSCQKEPCCHCLVQRAYGLTNSPLLVRLKRPLLRTGAAFSNSGNLTIHSVFVLFSFSNSGNIRIHIVFVLIFVCLLDNSPLCVGLAFERVARTCVCLHACVWGSEWVVFWLHEHLLLGRCSCTFLIYLYIYVHVWYIFIYVCL